MKTAIASAATASLALWAFDFMRLPRYELAQEVKLFAAHLVLGSVAGILVALSFRDRLTPSRLAAVSVAFTLTLALLSLLAMVGTYPQLFADRWWLGGGVLASIQVLVTHTLGPSIFDLLSVALLGFVVVTASVRGVRYRRYRGRHVATVAAAALVTALVHEALPTRANVAEKPANVLIVATESLGTLEDESSTPYLASRVSQGSLYRHAVTPIARTYPGWVSTLTGTEPRTHDVRHSYPSVEARSDVGPTLFTELRDRGYFTLVAADSAGGVFSGFAGGFETAETPRLDMRSLHLGATLHRHRFSLALLRFRWFRKLFPEWRNVPMLADPDWVVDDAVDALGRAAGRPFAGLVFFGSSQKPYVAPYPYYKNSQSPYRGRYLYHSSPIPPPEPPNREDRGQIEARHRGALTAIDAAIERLLRRVDERTLVVITATHRKTIAHGNSLGQSAPMLLLGPGVPVGVRSDAQVRHYDLPATVLDLLDGPRELGDGVTLLETDVVRPVCVETGIWLEPGERGSGLDYPGISRLVEIDPSSDELVLRTKAEPVVENAKARGLVLGHRLYREQMTTQGVEQQTISLDGPTPASLETDLATLFQERCVAVDPNLSRLYGAVVFERPER